MAFEVILFLFLGALFGQLLLTFFQIIVGHNSTKLHKFFINFVLAKN